MTKEDKIMKIEKLEKNIEEKRWHEFRDTGLLAFVNSFLHLFGWAIVFLEDTDSETGEKFISRVFPARTKFRGFDNEAIGRCYAQLSNYMYENGKVLKEESEEAMRKED